MRLQRHTPTQPGCSWMLWKKTLVLPSCTTNIRLNPNAFELESLLLTTTRNAFLFIFFGNAIYELYFLQWCTTHPSPQPWPRWPKHNYFLCIVQWDNTCMEFVKDDWTVRSRRNSNQPDKQLWNLAWANEQGIKQKKSRELKRLVRQSYSYHYFKWFG